MFKINTSFASNLPVWLSYSQFRKLFHKSLFFSKSFNSNAERAHVDQRQIRMCTYASAYIRPFRQMFLMLHTSQVGVLHYPTSALLQTKQKHWREQLHTHTDGQLLTRDKLKEKSPIVTRIKKETGAGWESQLPTILCNIYISSGTAAAQVMQSPTGFQIRRREGALASTVI